MRWLQFLNIKLLQVAVVNHLDIVLKHVQLQLYLELQLFGAVLLIPAVLDLLLLLWILELLAHLLRGIELARSFSVVFVKFDRAGVGVWAFE